MKNQKQVDSYRSDWDLFKVLLAINLYLLKLLLIMAQIASLPH